MRKFLYRNEKLGNYVDDVLAHTPNWQGHITVMRQFLPRDALLSVVYAVVVCLSVCVCVCVCVRHTPVLYQNG